MDISNLQDDVKKYYENMDNGAFCALLTDIYELVDLHILLHPTASPQSRLNSLSPAASPIIRPTPTNIIDIPTINIAAANAGIIGEDYFEKICEKLPDNYIVHNTAKIGHAGDFIIEYHYNQTIYKCLIDCKNYSKKIPAKEITKFHDDLKYGSYDSGLLLSYKSQILSKQEIDIIELNLPTGNIPVMYLQSFDTSIILQSIKLICLTSVVKSSKIYSSDRIQNALSYINTSLLQLSTIRRILSELSSDTSKRISQCQENLIGTEVQIKQSIRMLEFDIADHTDHTADIADHTNNTADIADAIAPTTDTNLAKHVITPIESFIHSHNNKSISAVIRLTYITTTILIDNIMHCTYLSDKHQVQFKCKMLKTKSKISCTISNIEAITKLFNKKTIDLTDEIIQSIESHLR